VDAPLQRTWRGRGALAQALRPLSFVYGVLTAARRALYRRGWLRTRSAGIPVIVVGNVVAGGAGKTPVVMALVDHLRTRGLRPGVVSRGYGRQTSDCREVTPGSMPAEVGDEPLLIARRSGVPVFVAPRRIDAAAALRRAHPLTDVIVSDDGLQHLALARDLELCVFDHRGVGNGWLLPAGPLREPWPRAVDFVLRTGDTPGVQGYLLERRLAGEAVRADGTRIPLEQLRQRRCCAVAGLASPEAFFAMLRGLGFELVHAEARPDHDPLDAEVMMPEPGTELLCTEKDAVKLWRHQPRAWAVPLVVAIEPAFWQALDRRLAAKLSSADGSQTS
jgi:tetraacyldisaccharide 4'-kinase